MLLIPLVVYVSMSIGLRCRYVRKNDARSGLTPCEQLLTDTFGARNKHKIVTPCRSSQAKSHFGPDPAAAASPVGSTVLQGILKSIKHELLLLLEERLDLGRFPGI